MVTGFYKSTVQSYQPKEPVQYVNSDSDRKTMSDIVNEVAPEFSHGSSFFVNPLLSSGHAQTAYTSLYSFENVDLVHYKRSLLNVDSENKFYYVNGDKMPYDRWKGKSTFCIDYAVPESASDPNHLKYKPESQTADLPPRTEYLNPETELSLLDNDKPLVIALHGLSGGSYEAYIRAFLNKITKDPYNFDALVLNARGCANHTITSPQLFCGLWTNDLRYLINEHVRKLWPNKKIFLIGFSLGGSIIANFLGQEGLDAYENIKAAAIMGSPWDYPQSSRAMNRSYLGNKIYSPTMCQNLLKLLKKHLQGPLSSDSLVADYIANPEKFELKLLCDFDDTFTSTLFGFNCASEYYRHASPDQRLLNVRVPMFIVASEDDPICGPDALPYSEVKLNPYTHMIVTSIGGHLGWFNFTLNRWYAEPLCRLFSALMPYDPEVNGAALPKATDGVWKHDRIIE